MQIKKSILPWARKWPFLVGLTIISASGCAMFQSNTPKAAGSFCATAGAYMSAISVGGTLAQQVQALNYAAVITPACSQTTPIGAESTAVSQAMSKLASLAAPYMIHQATVSTSTGATKS